jgi:hypothetical protein
MILESSCRSGICLLLLYLGFMFFSFEAILLLFAEEEPDQEGGNCNDYDATNYCTYDSTFRNFFLFMRADRGFRR